MRKLSNRQLFALVYFQKTVMYIKYQRFPIDEVFKVEKSIPDYKLWIETEMGDPIDQPANRPTRNFCNIQIILEDGPIYALNLWTFDFLPLARLNWPYDENSGKAAASYVLPPDLFVERLDRPTIEKVVDSLFLNNEMRDSWLCQEEE